jgi:hypothetical protein
VFYYLGVVALFFILGLVPHLLRGHRHGQIFKLAFISSTSCSSSRSS